MLYKYLSSVIAIAAVVWIVFAISSGELLRPTPIVLGIQSAADSQVLISKTEFDSTFTKARSFMADANENGNMFSLLENICKWLALFASAAITFIAGVSGKIVTEQSLGKVDTAQIPNRFIRLIAIIAAVNAICVGLSAQFQAEKLAAYQQVDVIQDKASLARKNILESNDAFVQQNLLDRLSLEMSR